MHPNPHPHPAFRLVRFKQHNVDHLVQGGRPEAGGPPQKRGKNFEEMRSIKTPHAAMHP